MFEIQHCCMGSIYYKLKILLADNREYIDVLNYLIENCDKWTLVSELKEKFNLKNSKQSYQQFSLKCSKKYGCGILESGMGVSINKNGRRCYNSGTVRIVSSTIPNVQRIIAEIN